MTQTRTNFVVLFQGRTGSSYLIDVLAKHRDIFAGGEMLADEPRGPLSFRKRLAAATRGLRDGFSKQRQLEMTRRFYAEAGQGKQVIGFKTKVKDMLDLTGMKEVLEAAHVRAIILQRTNLVKQTVSRLNAARLYQTSQDWNLHREQDRLGSFTIDPAIFDQHLREVVFDREMLQAFAAYLDAPRLDLSYDDLLLNRQKWFDSVFEFLGVESVPLRSDVLKNTPDDLRDVVENFAELKQRYRGTEFDAMFDEVALQVDA